MLDLIMPGMSARDVFFELRRLMPEQPVLFCSGFAPKGMVEDLLELPRTQRINKPYATEDLERMIRSLLR